MSYSSPRDIESVTHLLLRLKTEADTNRAPSIRQQSLEQDLRALWHLGMMRRDSKRPKPAAAGSSDNPIIVDDEDEAPALQLDLHAPVIGLNPRWHVTKQQNCIVSVLGLLQSKPNVVFSPFSLMSCMAMMCRGASRDKEGALAYKQLAHYCWPTDDASDIYDNASHEALKVFVTQLAKNPACEWINIIMSDQLKEDYVQDIETNFEAKNRATSAWKQVNAEVNTVTRMTSDVLPDKPSGSVLINAIYFKDLWILPFKEKLTSMKFTTCQNTISNVKMMTLKATLRIAKHGHMTAVNMPYQTLGMGAWFVKNSGPTGHQDSLSFDTLTSFVQQEFVSQTLTTSETLLEVMVPQFELHESIDLRQVFQALPSHKITEIFNEGNLGRMTTNNKEFFSIFKQDCMLKVDPNGTTASARTWGGTTRSLPPPCPKITFAHTFYMVIYHRDTILFVAKIGSPQHFAQSGGITPEADNVEDTKDGLVSALFAHKTQNLQLQNKRPSVDVCMEMIQRSIKISTKLHDGKDDEHGELIDTNGITDAYEDDSGNAIAADQIEGMLAAGKATLIRTYTVVPKLLIRVVITFPSPAGTSKEEKDTTKIHFTPVYVKDTGEKEPEDEVYSKYDEPYEFAFPLQKEADEKEDGLEFKDNTGKIFLKLRFRL